MKKEFAVVAFNPKHKAFVIHIVIFSIDSDNNIHLSKKAQIAHLKIDKVFSKVSSKYIDFADIFSLNLDIELPE